ncbi:MAG: hypothetical protein NTY32_02310, partial [Bacteroidia bacterium]|nr:hypothetical protein [Bacteroidia bacterium]
MATASTLTTNGAVTMNGAFQLNLGGSATGTGAWAYNGASGSLVYNTGGTTTSTDIEWPTSTSPANVTVQNATSVNLNNPKTINGTLTLSSGSLNNTTNGLTLGDGATVITNAGSLTAAPTFSSRVNLTY